MMRVAGARGHLLLAVAALAVASLPLWATPYMLGLASTALLAGMLALGLQLLVGGAGMVSLGHAGFFGVGAYAVYLVVSALGGSASVLQTLPAAMALAGLAALVTGALALRTRAFYFLMVTLAFGQCLYFVFHDTPLGGGKDGVFVARPLLEAFGWEWAIPRRSRPAAMLWLNLGVLAGMYAFLAWLVRTQFGRALAGIRANEHRMRALGYDTYRLKLAAFVVAGVLAGVAGHMAAMTDGFVNPEMLGWHRSATALVVVLLGGLGWLHGPLLGAAALAALGEAASLLTERQRLVEGLVILAAVLVLPQGLAGLRLAAPRRSKPEPAPAELRA